MSYTDTKNKIDAIRSKIEQFGLLSEEQKKKINYKFRLEWNYNSNSMEGNTLTIEETRSLMVGNLTLNDKPYKDVVEMKGHDEVVSQILQIGKGELRLSETRIKEIHKTIMHEENKLLKTQIGTWKTDPNMIYNHKGEKYDFVKPEEVKDKMHELLNRTNASIDAIQMNKKNAPHALDVALQFHLEYLDIHPFYDGNGRTARILTNLILISLGYTPFWITEKEREVYYRFISDIQGYGGDKELFYDYVAKLILRSQQLVLDAIEGKDIEEEDDLKKEIVLLRRKLYGRNFTKSPQNVFNVFEFVRDDVWTKVFKAIARFDEFFSESKTEHFVNNDSEKFEVISFLKVFNPLERSTKPEELKIFGHEIYADDINIVEWHHVKYGLKSSKTTTQYDINFRLQFETAGYSIKASLNYKDIFEKHYSYDEFPDNDATVVMATTLAKDMLHQIKNDIN